MEMKMGGACSVTVDNGNWVHQHLSITFMVSHQHLQCYTDIYSVTPTFTILHQHLQCYTDIYSVTPTFTVLHQHLQYYTNTYSMQSGGGCCEDESGGHHRGASRTTREWLLGLKVRKLLRGKSRKYR